MSVARRTGNTTTLAVVCSHGGASPENVDSWPTSTGSVRNARAARVGLRVGRFVHPHYTRDHHDPHEDHFRSRSTRRIVCSCIA
jgi:hypothetical protein